MSNASCVYKMILSNLSYSQSSDWDLSKNLTTNHVWDSFVILSLLEDGVQRGRLLSVPHIGDQADCFNLQWRSIIDGLFQKFNLMLYNMHVISACECFFNLMGFSVCINSSLISQLPNYDSFVLIASKMPGNHWGWFEHGLTMLWCI